MVIELNKNYNQNVKGKNFYVTFTSPIGAAGSIIGGLRISPYSYSSTILNVTLSTPVPQKGRDILSRLFVIYNREAVAEKNQIADKTMNFIDERLIMVTSQLDSVERSKASFQTRTSVEVGS